MANSPYTVEFYDGGKWVPAAFPATNPNGVPFTVDHAETFARHTVEHSDATRAKVLDNDFAPARVVVEFVKSIEVIRH